MQITNEVFLKAVFGAAYDRAHVTGFSEGPDKLEDLGLRHYWGGTRFKDAPSRWFGTGFNQYFAISLFRDDPGTGKARRRDELFEGLYAVILDDVGTKVTLPPTVSPPNWRLETSPGNEQWGWILCDPERDYGRANALIEGLIAKGLSDPGAKGVTRYGRLPEGWNTKNGGKFKCQLNGWLSGGWAGFRDAAHMAAHFGIELPVAGTVTAGKSKTGTYKGPDGLLEALSELGMVRGNAPLNPEGWWDIECPWQDEHTAGVASGAAYRPGGAGDPGAFKCHHGHCEGRRRRDLARYVEGRIYAESGGLAHFDEWAFDPVNPSSIDPGRYVPSRDADEEDFLENHIYIQNEDKFLCLSSETLVRPGALDLSWAYALRDVLPIVNQRTQARMAPSRWFVQQGRIAKRMTTAPGEGEYFRDENGDWCANMWRRPMSRLGLGRVSDGDVEPWLSLVRHVTSRDGTEATEWLLDWFALVVGAPGVKPGWHVLVQGPQGLGKDMIVQPVIWGAGDRNTATANAKSLHSDFNAWAEKRLVLVNELKQLSRGASGGIDQYNALKELTENTQRFISINRKNQQLYKARNIAAFYITSNDPEALAIEADDRRFLVIMAGTAADTPKWPQADYVALRDWLVNQDGLALCAEWLHQRWESLSKDRRDALLGAAPGTPGKLQLARDVEDVVQAYMREQIETGAWPDLMSSTDVNNALAAAARNGTGGFKHPVPSKRWARYLRALGGDKVYKGQQVRLLTGARLRLWATKGPERYSGMSEAALAQAYKSAAGHLFADPENTATVLQFPEN